MIPADNIGMLALPAEAGGFGQRLFHHRRGVDKDFYLAFRLTDQPAGGALKRALDDIMIVLALRIDRYPAVIGHAFQGKRILGGRVAHSQHDHRLHIGPQSGRISALIGPVGHPDHITLAAFAQPLLQALPGFGRQSGGGDTDGGEPLFHRLFFERFGQS